MKKILNCLASLLVSVYVFSQSGDKTNKKIEIGAELEIYPVGFMPVITSNVFIKKDWALRFRIGGNFADRLDFSGLNDSEIAKGFGGSVGVVKYFPIRRGDIIVGFTVDVWRMKTEWIDKTEKGTTTNLVIQPWINSGYLYDFSKKFNAGISLGFGREINTLNKGEKVGQGWLGIIAISTNYSLN